MENTTATINTTESQAAETQALAERLKQLEAVHPGIIARLEMSAIREGLQKTPVDGSAEIDDNGTVEEKILEIIQSGGDNFGIALLNELQGRQEEIAGRAASIPFEIPEDVEEDDDDETPTYSERCETALELPIVRSVAEWFRNRTAGEKLAILMMSACSTADDAGNPVGRGLEYLTHIIRDEYLAEFEVATCKAFAAKPATTEEIVAFISGLNAA